MAAAYGPVGACLLVVGQTGALAGTAAPAMIVAAAPAHAVGAVAAAPMVHPADQVAGAAGLAAVAAAALMVPAAAIAAAIDPAAVTAGVAADAAVTPKASAAVPADAAVLAAGCCCCSLYQYCHLKAHLYVAGSIGSFRFEELQFPNLAVNSTVPSQEYPQHQDQFVAAPQQQNQFTAAAAAAAAKLPPQ